MAASASPRREPDSLDGGGAAPFGNFHNYYNFNPATERLAAVPPELLREALEPAEKKAVGDLLVLDVGCNEGNVTFELHSMFSDEVRSLQAAGDSSGGAQRLAAALFVGLDVDKTLIERARAKASALGAARAARYRFECADIMTLDTWRQLQALLAERGADKFDLVCCLSVTMWIHLHHGDAGLLEFLHRVAQLSRHLVIEPQPWHCYKRCRERWRKIDKQRDTPLEWTGYKIRNNVDDFILRHLAEREGMTLRQTLKETRWARKVVWFSDARCVASSSPPQGACDLSAREK